MVKKSKSCVADMAKTIAERFVERRGQAQAQCGIVYCLSRKQCEEIATKLQVSAAAPVCERCLTGTSSHVRGRRPQAVAAAIPCLVMAVQHPRP